MGKFATSQSVPTQVNSTVQSSRNSPEPAQTDRQGHYVGPASGASFLLRLQHKLQGPPLASSSELSIFTFGDQPLPEIKSRFIILPPRAKADAMLCRYFEYSAATHRFLHRATVEGWLAELYETEGLMRDQSDAGSRIAVIFLVFAFALNYTPQAKSGIIDPAARYFAVQNATSMLAKLMLSS